ncbi:DUF6235 family protein [Amycolatopsis sp. QT-25]|uniref:DUF6235 family protein n=1 Tax=Amycolatopsis sp. QT-25 TaxID=3034022 RepID=UPI0023ECAF89|nr:DUF6235 family protein [Amycolatopsis sp. QT-25]WET76183.1 DUF6235 family protein [Amycolatopsis sp. QT-25]
MGVGLRLTAGLDVLEDWAVGATQAERNVVYETLFAIGDGSVSVARDVLGGPQDFSDVVVVVRRHLVLRIAIHSAGASFEIRYVGAPDKETIDKSYGDL